MKRIDHAMPPRLLLLGATLITCMVFLCLTRNSPASNAITGGSPIVISTPSVVVKTQSSSGRCDSFTCAAQRNLTAYKGSVLQNFHGAFREFQAHDWGMFGPVISCPPHRPLMRYGKGDGGKLLCQLDISSSSASPCLIYSLGSNGNYRFEEAMLKHTSCDIHTFDCTWDGHSIDPKRHFYHKWCLGNGTGDHRTWGNITHSLGHSQVDLLKMDIEGFEYQVLSEFKATDNLPKEISMELHTRQYHHKQSWPKSPAEIALVFMHMANLGYAVYSQEVNGLATWCCEFSFLRVSAGN